MPPFSIFHVHVVVIVAVVVGVVVVLVAAVVACWCCLFVDNGFNKGTKHPTTKHYFA